MLVGALAGSADIYALGMGCRLEEIEDVWRKRASPIRCRRSTVDDAPCQEVVITGEELTRDGGGSAACRSRSRRRASTMRPTPRAGHWVTKDPDTGMHNLGNYRGMVKAEDRIGVLLGRLNWGMR